MLTSSSEISDTVLVFIAFDVVASTFGASFDDEDAAVASDWVEFDGALATDVDAIVAHDQARSNKRGTKQTSSTRSSRSSVIHAVFPRPSAAGSSRISIEPAASLQSYVAFSLAVAIDHPH